MAGQFDDSEIAVVGEAIMDMIPDASGRFQACVGGSPYNVARAIGLQQAPACYLSPFSSDDFGSLLATQLHQDGLAVDPEFVVNRPTSLAVVNFAADGSPRYSLYREGIADSTYTAEDVIRRLPEKLKYFHVGSLALVPSELDKVRAIFKALHERGVIVCVDLNARPNVVEDHEAYVEGLLSLLPDCDLVKASDEDMQILGLAGDMDSMVAALLERQQGGLVAITAGSNGAVMANRNHRAQIAAFQVTNIGDTVGAGDCFQAGMIAGLYNAGISSSAELEQASEATLATVLRAASASAAINVGRTGCQPPTRDELEKFLGENA